VLCEEREEELESLADAVYRHIYERVVKFSYQPQSDYGVLFLSQAQPSLSNREVTIAPVEMRYVYQVYPCCTNKFKI
jgi:hypothetical protein